MSRAQGFTILVVVLAAAAVPARAQPAVQQGLDSIAARAPAGAPGCAVAAAGPGFGRAEKAYGMADLERGVANTPQTIFEAGSVSKQFTAAAVVLLAQRGQLSLDDDIRKYVPEVPDFGERPITIRRMLNHSSGLRDWGVIAGIQGWPRGTRAYTNAHVLDIVAHQRKLNFAPGDEWMYSNTNYNLAAILVQRVSGKSLAEFTHDEFFVPLGMTHTSWRDDYTRVVPGRALAYAPTRQGFRTDMPNEDAYGNGGLLTTVRDLLTWNAAELDSGKVGGRALPAELEREAVLTGGKRDGYGLGLFLTDSHGVREISHTGATGGYRAFLARWPDRQASLAVLCNGGGAGANVAALAALVLGGANVAAKAAPATVAAGRPGRPGRPERSGRPQPTRVALDAAHLAAMAGLYREQGSMQPFPLIAGDGVLKARSDLVLEPVSATELRPATGEDLRVVFPRPGSAHGRPMVLRTAGKDTTLLEPVVAFDSTKLADYAGDWYSPEAQVTWTLALEHGQLLLTLGPGMRLPLRPAYADGVTGPGGSVLVFDRDAAGRVSGLGVWMDRARDMRFERR